MKMFDRSQTRFDLAAFNRRAEQPRPQEPRTHAGYGCVNHAEQRVRAASVLCFCQFEIAHGHGVK